MSKLINSILFTSMVFITTGCVGETQPKVASSKYANQKSGEISQRVSTKVDSKVDSAIDNNMNKVFGKLGL